MLTVTTRDRDGNPVSAEVALGMIDESVLYIQKEYAGDPRQFFYGTKRGKLVRTASTFHVKRYVRLGDDRDDASNVTPFEDERRRKEELTEAPSLQRAVGGAAMDAVMEEAEGFSVAKKSMAQAPSVAPAESDASEGPAVQVRSDFRATALWAPDVVTGEDGTATIPVKFPDSLTTWKATARVATTDNRFGTATTTSKTSKPLLVRLQAPRFFVVGDRLTVSAVINNNTDAPIDVTPSLTPDGLEIAAGGEAVVRVPATGEARVDWTVEAREAGTARLEVVARGGDHADAMARDYRVWEHGVEKLVALSGKTRGDRASVVVDLPRERRPGSTSMIVQVTPSLAVTMLDALPYLIDYPYGCTEQTMSRFLPAAITARTLDGLGLKPAEVAGRLFGGIESETSAQTHPDGPNDLARLDDMVRKGLTRLYDFQHADGGWGWWKEGDSDPYMTAYVVWGLGIARDAGIKVDSNVLQRGASYLNIELVEQESRPDLQAWMLHALTSSGAGRRGSATDFQRKAYDNLWAQRSSLNAYSISLLALSAHHLGDTQRTGVLIRNLENGVVRDEAPDTSDLLPGRAHQAAVTATAHWGADGLYWRWSEGPVEATSFALRALLAIDPDHALVEPVTNWLIKNRRGAQWSNTRDTAMAVLTLSDYLVASGELDSEVEYEVRVNGHGVTRQRVTAADVLAAPGRFEVDPSLVRDGANTVEIVRLGGRPRRATSASKSRSRRRATRSSSAGSTTAWRPTPPCSRVTFTSASPSPTSTPWSAASGSRSSSPSRRRTTTSTWSSRTSSLRAWRRSGSAVARRFTPVSFAPTPSTPLPNGVDPRISPAEPAGSTRSFGTARWCCSSTSSPRAGGRSGTISARRFPGPSTRFPCWDTRCTCPRSGATAPRSGYGSRIDDHPGTRPHDDPARAKPPSGSFPARRGGSVPRRGLSPRRRGSLHPRRGDARHHVTGDRTIGRGRGSP
jgi:hypothetical protein